MEDRGKSARPTTRVPIVRENVLLFSKPPPPPAHVHAAVHAIPPSGSVPQQRTGLISLTDPRPPQSNRNVYVETPTPIKASSSHNAVISTQPTALKRPTSTSHVDATPPCEESIICPRCDRCRCRACTAKRELPKYWCGTSRTTEVSAQCVVEWCTCLKAVKCCFDILNIHDREHENPLSDRPCACCGQPHCCKRWTCMAMMSVCLPCLCLYPFLKCGLMMCTCCYNCATRKGCACSQRNPNPRSGYEPGRKGLIDYENSSST